MKEKISKEKILNIAYKKLNILQNEYPANLKLDIKIVLDESEECSKEYGGGYFKIETPNVIYLSYLLLIDIYYKKSLIKEINRLVSHEYCHLFICNNLYKDCELGFKRIYHRHIQNKIREISIEQLEKYIPKDFHINKKNRFEKVINDSFDEFSDCYDEVLCDIFSLYTNKEWYRRDFDLNIEEFHKEVIEKFIVSEYYFVKEISAFDEYDKQIKIKMFQQLKEI